MSSGWNHNSHYHDVLLRAVPRPCGRALDVGCGQGDFARRLAVVADRVDAIDRDAAMIAAVRQRCADLPNVHVVQADFLRWGDAGAYDYVSMIATLHHMPMREALTHAADLLRPGGRLALLGLYRVASITDLASCAVAYPVSWFHRATRVTAGDAAPIQAPAMTFAEIRGEVATVLPDATSRLHLLWRYSLIWTKPAG